jgi:hypothetical protein
MFDRPKCYRRSPARCRNDAQRLCRKSIGLALRRPVEEGDKLIDDGAPIRLRSDVGGDEALGLDAEDGVDAEARLRVWRFDRPWRFVWRMRSLLGHNRVEG